MTAPRKELPDFDDLVELASTDPERLEHLRRLLIDDLIEHAPDSQRQRLKGLQFTIDMERRRAKNPVQCCVRMSQLMYERVADLRESLLELNAQPVPYRVEDARVVPFPIRKREDDDSPS
ncbi:MAG: DUF3135 domain-containing protein [Saccharospirillum sp.]